MESENFAKQIMKLFRECGMTSGYRTSADRERPNLDRLGLTMHVKNVTQLPRDAQILKRAFDAAGIDCTVTSEQVVATAVDHFLAIRVGLRPE